MARGEWSEADQAALRNDVFLWLDAKMRERGGVEVSRKELATYEFRGENIPLVDTTRGIRNPRQLSSTLSILTTAKGQKTYQDTHDEDWVTYSYRRGEGGDNIKLVAAYARQDPLVYFMPVSPGYYLPYFPIYLAENDPANNVVRFHLDPEHGPNAIADTVLDPMAFVPKKYELTQVRRRVHQPVFRAKVLAAYESQCAICSLEWAELLDAAHIIPDSFEHGVPEVPNGMALCKIHHAAYDRNFIGIDDAYQVVLSKRVQLESPAAKMLGAASSATLNVPKSVALRPDRKRLAERFEAFTHAEGQLARR